MKNLTLIMLLLLFPAAAFSQTRTVSGHISDTDGEPLAGVNVMVQGTMTGSMSDGEGRYSIRVPEGEVTLVFSFIGMKTEEIPVGGVETCLM